jgi:hypothetical protein
MGKPVTLISKSAAMFFGRTHSLGPQANGGETAAPAKLTAEASGFAGTGGALLRTALASTTSAVCPSGASPPHAL